MAGAGAAFGGERTEAGAGGAKVQGRAGGTASSDWWAVGPLVKPPIPAGLAPHPIDALVRDALRRQGRDLAPEADRRTLLRRLTVDLHGLLPSRGEVGAFEADDRPDALERRVDRALASPRYGERWARHWMDVVHFAETHGHDQDRPREHAWPYREYLIEAFNTDKPYARFIEEQVAADALFPGEPELTPALGFLAAGPWDESSLRDIREDTLDREIGRYLDRDDIVANVMSTFAAVTVHCARCHDHKFDPVPQEDYYALQAVFAGTEKAERLYDRDPVVHQERQFWMRLQVALDRQDAAQVTKLLSGGTARRLGLNPDSASGGLSGLTNRVAEALGRLPAPRRVYAGANVFPVNAGQKPLGQPRPVKVLRRGEITRPVGDAQPGTLTCVEGLPARFEADEDEAGRRAALARWLSHPDNPLTWRVMVNRVWHLHFGRGIVETPNDFGRMGGVPASSALLDWLAVTFRDDLEGSLKALQRLILTSQTWRQRATEPGSGELLRPLRRRLDAEAIRDSILQISGHLDLAMGGPSVKQFVMTDGIHVTPNVDYGAYDLASSGAARRSVYRFLFRTLPDPLMDSLDCPAGDQSAPVRNESFTALQAFALWNHPFVVRASAGLAARLEASHAEGGEQVRSMAALVFQREPDPGEWNDWLRYAERHGLANLGRLFFNANEFHFLE